MSEHNKRDEVTEATLIRQVLFGKLGIRVVEPPEAGTKVADSVYSAGNGNFVVDDLPGPTITPHN